MYSHQVIMFIFWAVAGFAGVASVNIEIFWISVDGV
jgi:hypothetical protein